MDNTQEKEICTLNSLVDQYCKEFVREHHRCTFECPFYDGTKCSMYYIAKFPDTIYRILDDIKKSKVNSEPLSPINDLVKELLNTRLLLEENSEKWFREHPFSQAAVTQCNHCKLLYITKLGHKCTKEEK